MATYANVKVKIFCNIDLTKLENDVNDFIKDKIIIDIRYQSFGMYTRFTSNCCPTDAEVSDRVLIIYKELPKYGYSN